MVTNIGVLDRAFRILLGALLLGWSYGKLGSALPAGSGWLVWTIGLAFALTGIFRFCPLYAYFGTDSCALKPGEDSQ